MRSGTRKSKRAHFASMVIVTVATVVVATPLVASAGGYPTPLPKRVNIVSVTAAMSGGGTVGFYLKTNSRGQVTQAIPGNTQLHPVSCPGQQPSYIGTNAGSQNIGGGPSGEIYGVGTNGTFTYRELFLSTPYTLTVQGRVSAQGRRVSGTVIVTSSTPGVVDGITGCTDPTSPATFSGSLHWKKFA